MTHKSWEERSRTMSWKSWTMPSTLFQKEKKTGSKYATMAKTSLMTTQGGTVAQVTGKQTRPPQVGTRQSDEI